MPQPNQQLDQQVQVKEKTQVMQKVVLGTGVLCTTVMLFNFAVMFNAGVNGVGKLLAADNNSKQTASLESIDEDRNVAARLSLNRSLNDREPYTGGETEVTLLAMDIENVTSTVLQLNEISFFTHVNGAADPSVPNRFTPAMSTLDGGVVYAGDLISNLNLYWYHNGEYTLLNSTTTEMINNQGYVTFEELSLTLFTNPPNDKKTIVLKGDVSHNAPYGQYADAIAFDIKEWRTDVFIYDLSGNRYSVGPNAVNGATHPRVYHQIIESGTLNVTCVDNPAIANIVAGSADVPMQNLKFQAIDEAFNVNKLRIYQAQGDVYDRAVASATINYENEAGETVTATQSMINGQADFNITSDPIYVPANTYRIVNVYFDINPITQTYQTYTGDIVKAGFDADGNFEARSAGSGSTTLTQTSNNFDCLGNAMTVYGNFPTIVIDYTSNISLFNGPVEIHRWEVSAQEGGTDVTMAQLSFWVTLMDTVPSNATLTLTNFQVYEGDSYASAEALTQSIYGTDSYRVWSGSGDVLSSATGSISAYASSTNDVIVTFYDDRLIQAGDTKYYILKAIASNVDTGPSSNDNVSSAIIDGDTSTTSVIAADFSPESSGVDEAILDTDPTNLQGTEYPASMIYSDMTGTNGNYIHNQSTVFGGSSSMDWISGYKIKYLNVVRRLD